MQFLMLDIDMVNKVLLSGKNTDFHHWKEEQDMGHQSHVSMAECWV